VPPDTVSGPLLKKVFTVPEVVAGQVTEIGGLIVIAQLVPTAPVESVTLTKKLPEVVGVPLIAPVLVFSVRPIGNVPMIEYV
jgi:hypothetical protein